MWSTETTTSHFIELTIRPEVQGVAKRRLLVDIRDIAHVEDGYLGPTLTLHSTELRWDGKSSNITYDVVESYDKVRELMERLNTKRAS